MHVSLLDGPDCVLGEHKGNKGDTSRPSQIIIHHNVNFPHCSKLSEESLNLFPSSSVGQIYDMDPSMVQQTLFLFICKRPSMGCVFSLLLLQLTQFSHGAWNVLVTNWKGEIGNHFRSSYI